MHHYLCIVEKDQVRVWVGVCRQDEASVTKAGATSHPMQEHHLDSALLQLKLERNIQTMNL